jgi:hypothetical protein
MVPFAVSIASSPLCAGMTGSTGGEDLLLTGMG